MAGGMGGGGIGMRDMLAQQNRDMDALERRGRERPRGIAPTATQQIGGGMVGGAGGGMAGGQGMQQRQAVSRIDDDDSAGTYIFTFTLLPFFFAEILIHP